VTKYVAIPVARKKMVITSVNGPVGISGRWSGRDLRPGGR